MAQSVDQEERLTLWIGGLHQNVTEDILFELFQNAGPVQGVRIPFDSATKRPKNFAFIKFHHEESLPYAFQIFRDVTLFGQKLCFPRDMQNSVPHGSQRPQQGFYQHQQQQDNRGNDHMRRNGDSFYQRYNNHTYLQNDYRETSSPNPWNHYEPDRGMAQRDSENRRGREDHRGGYNRYPSRSDDFEPRDRSPDRRSRSFNRNQRERDDRDYKQRDHSYEPRRR